MKKNSTAKFGSFLNNDSFIDRVKTQLTQNFVRSQTNYQPNESQMNISQLQMPVKEQKSINVSEEIEHQVNGSEGKEETIYRCPICDRLRAICPYKSYQTYQHCQKCLAHKEEKRHQRQRIHSNATPSFTKELNSTFAETRGHSFSRGLNNFKIDFGTRNLTEVDRVRFVQSNNVYPLGSVRNKANNVSQYQFYSKQHNASKYDTKKVERPRSTTQHVIRQSNSNYQHAINQQKVIPAPPNIEEIIFYPVIHNKLVYKSAQKATKNVQELGENVQMKHYRYQSNRSERKSRRRVDKAVSDFLQTTQPDEILTPFQFKRLADSIYRETNPNVLQE